MERSVRRSELESTSSPASSPEPISLDRWTGLNEFDFIDTAHRQDEPHDNEADELSFRLFAPKKTEGPQMVKIRSPTPEIKEAGFIRPARDSSYYFSSSQVAQSQAFKECAVSIDDIQKLASIKWTGSACPWKVLNLPASGLAKSTRQQLNGLWKKTLSEETTPKRKRRSKKARIKLRLKISDAKQKAADNKLAQQSKEDAERDKKTRRNREKKAKKRQRDKMKKTSGLSQEGAKDDSDDSAE